MKKITGLMIFWLVGPLFSLCTESFTKITEPSNKIEAEQKVQLLEQDSLIQKPCSSPEASQFDFWIGVWEAEWESSDGEKKKATNTITKILDGCVIEENFNGNPGNELIGKSLSVFNPRTKKWHQTWVDNYGGYLDFTGEFKNDKMILERDDVDSKGNNFKQRMVFYNIKKDSFIWDWEKSTDNGRNWELSWKIYYSRFKK